MRSAVPGSGSARTRALLVEPHPAMVPYLRAVLERAGHVVVATRSASRATLRRTKPDTILLGPGANARPLETIRRIRDVRSTARIVAITYAEDSVWRALALALGADEILGPHDDLDLLERALCGSNRGEENESLRRTS